MYFRTRLVRDRQVQRAGDAVVCYHDRPEFGSFHDAFIIAQTEATRSISFGGFVVARYAVCEKDRLHIVGETDLPFTTDKPDTDSENAEIEEFRESHYPVLLVAHENGSRVDIRPQSWLST